MGHLDRLLGVWLAQRGALFPWAPVFFACGIGTYFALKWEPSGAVYAGLGAGAMLCLGLALVWRGGLVLPPLLFGCLMVLLGFYIAGMRAHLVADPILGWRYYGAVEGRIVAMDRSSSDALRLTLDRVHLSNVAPGKTPARVRISLHGAAAAGAGSDLPKPGTTVILTAHLSPPSGPVEPAGFDFQRHAWFQGLGAVGYTRTPVLVLEPPQGGQWVFKARMWLSARVQAALPGETGGFAAAIMAGDRSGVGQDTLEALRISNLAHLLAISGLHMGLLAGVVFGAVRFGLALVPRVALRVPVRKVAAIAAIVMGAGYLALSGGNVATERAFIMVAVMLCAVLADRRALSLRAVAMAALVVLALRPEALLGPGFQMSFAATTALVAVFGEMRDRRLRIGPAWVQPVLGVLLSSLVAGLATAPFAAAHFNHYAQFGLIANLVSVPLMGTVVMPAAVLAAVLMPLGLDWLPLMVMGAGLDWILGVAHWVSGLEGARRTVIGPGPWVLPLLSLGALVVILWQGRLRLAGAVPMLAGAILWLGAERPDVLIADTGGIVGVMTEQGRALSRERGSGFIALNWLENDGDTADQGAAHARWQQRATAKPGWPIRVVAGKRAAEAFEGCEAGEWVVFNTVPKMDMAGYPCRILTPRDLRRTGAVALTWSDDGPKTLTAREVTGARLWNTARRD